MVRLSTGSGTSIQNRRTPANFIQAVMDAYGPIAFDLAAERHNTWASRYYAKEQDYLCEGVDSLAQDWGTLSHNLIRQSVMWLNPEFDDIAPWATKCAESRLHLRSDMTIAFLVPASVGSNWFRDYVYQHARVRLLNGRLIFDGCTTPYPKDCLLALYANGLYSTEIDVWNWREQNGSVPTAANWATTATDI